MRFSKLHSVRGVTLLEILLVLTISASILIMSIRYYGSATSSLHTNTALQQIEVITAIVDNYAIGTSYTGINTETVKSLLPSHALTTPWGTDIVIKSVASNAYEVVLPATPTQICPLILSKLAANTHYKVSSICGQSTTDFTYRYVANV